MNRNKLLVIAMLIAIPILTLIGSPTSAQAMDICSSELTVTYSWSLVADSLGYKTEVKINGGIWELLNESQTETNITYVRAPTDLTIDFRVTNKTLCGEATATYAEVLNVMPDPIPVSGVLIATSGGS